MEPPPTGGADLLPKRSVEPSAQATQPDSLDDVNTRTSRGKRKRKTKMGVQALASACDEQSFVGRTMRLLATQQDLDPTKSKFPLRRQALLQLTHLADWWEHLTEPERQGCPYKVESSRWFASISSLSIVANSIFLALGADWEMAHLGRERPQIFDTMEVAFLIYFAAEIALRLCVHGAYFFVNEDHMWNIFDFGLVMLSLIDAVLSTVVASEGKDNNMSFMRILRLLKLAKILRALRVLKVFRELSTIMESFKKSMISLFWSMFMLTFLLYVFGLIFIQGVSRFLMDRPSISDADALQLRDLFSSVSRSMLTLYMAVTGGVDWVLYFDILSKVGGFYAAVFILFTVFFTFAVLNILTGVFVEKAVAAAIPDREELVLAQRRNMLKDAQEFRHLCLQLDHDHKGHISLEEFQNNMTNETMVAYMASVGLEIHDVELFFRVVAGHDQTVVGIDEFVDGAGLALQVRLAACLPAFHHFAHK